jgi:glycine/D-amino acid oxidase-like deaminating enzyme
VHVSAGHGAGTLLQDADCLPIRGQIRRVAAPWIKHITFLDDVVYILPNVGSVVVGGTQQRGDDRDVVDEVDTERIWQRATALVPGLLGAEVIKDWVRSRPVLLLQAYSTSRRIAADARRQDVH